MLYVNPSLLKKIPEPLQGVMEYYPDVLLFELDQTQYTHLWREIVSAKYLYTNGYEIRPTNWFMYFFQRVKGWFGLNNACHPEKIAYTLDKLAYYGYKNQFVQPNFSLVQYSMSPEICRCSSFKRDDVLTDRLQKRLITEFCKRGSNFIKISLDQDLSPNHRFGDSWKKINEIESIPPLDPQDDSLIIELVNDFEMQGYPPDRLNFMPKSKYTRIAADYYFNKFNSEYDKSKNQYRVNRWLKECFGDQLGRVAGYLAKALAYDSGIIHKDPLKLISYYMEIKDYSTAFNVLSLLNDFDLERYFIKKIPENTLISLVAKIKPDTSLAVVMARFYIEEKDYNSAKKYVTHIEELSPLAAFNLEIQENNYSKAYDIFLKYEENPNLFPNSDRKKLAKIFSREGEIAYKAGKLMREAKRWSEAEQYYRESLTLKKTAYQLSTKYLNEMYTHKRLYALVLIDADIDLHQPEASEGANILKAITLLEECQSPDEDEQNLKKYALSKGLMRQIDTLQEKIALDSSQPADFNSLKKYQNQHQEELNRFIKKLEEVISLLQGASDQEQRWMLGKAHYLLADVQDYSISILRISTSIIEWLRRQFLLIHFIYYVCQKFLSKKKKNIGIRQ